MNSRNPCLTAFTNREVLRELGIKLHLLAVAFMGGKTAHKGYSYIVQIS